MHPTGIFSIDLFWCLVPLAGIAICQYEANRTRKLNQRYERLIEQREELNKRYGELIQKCEERA